VIYLSVFLRSCLFTSGTPLTIIDKPVLINIIIIFVVVFSKNYFRLKTITKQNRFLDTKSVDKLVAFFTKGARAIEVDLIILGKTVVIQTVFYTNMNVQQRIC